MKYEPIFSCLETGIVCTYSRYAVQYQKGLLLVEQKLRFHWWSRLLVLASSF